jgi:hypothetical protein
MLELQEIKPVTAVAVHGCWLGRDKKDGLKYYFFQTHKINASSLF